MRKFDGYISRNFISSKICGAFRTDRNMSPGGTRATLIIHDEDSHVEPTQQVYQYKYKNNYGNWLLTRRLYTKADAAMQFEGSCEYAIHTGPFEVPL